MKYKYRRNRSDFWVTIYYNDESYSISSNSKYVSIINYFFPMLEENSPTKWKDSNNYTEVSNLWLPEGCYNQKIIEKFMNWCEKATNDILWLYLGKNISDYFSDELDFCIASDFNYVYGNGRTEIGEAEYQLKYNFSNLNMEDEENYANLIMSKMLDNCKYIPIENRENCFASPMPATENDKKKLAWMLAVEMANCMNVKIMNPTLLCSKPQMKQLAVEDRIETWRDIYNNKEVQIDEDVRDKDIIIIDDLYQSGATMWEYASYLKKMGARMVFGVVCVKSLKDSDNT